MATFETFVPRIPVVQAVQWTDDPEVVDDLRVWLADNYGPETAGIIDLYDGEGLTPPGPRGWEIAEDGRLFVKQSEDHFWTNLGDWLILQEFVNNPNELAPMDEATFNATYQTPTD